MSTFAGDAQTSIILKKRYLRVGCHVCKSHEHTYISCPNRPCYLCKQVGHLSTSCPHRLLPGAHDAALKAFLAARDKRNRILPFLRNREIDPSPTAVHPSLLYFRNPQFDCKAAFGMRRYHKKRITAVQWHPSGRYVVSGDKSGLVKLWDLGDAVAGDYFQAAKLPKPDSEPALLHYCNITNFVFDPAQDDLVYTGASDGMVTATRLALTSSHRDSSEGDPTCVTERTGIVNLNPEGWHGQKSFKMAYGMAYDPDRKCLYVGVSNGDILRKDPREDSTTSPQMYARFHKAKVTCIHVNPVNSNLIATASNDKKVCLWDARKFVPRHSLGSYVHGRAISSAYFSPNTGSKLLTTSMDNKIQIWSDVHAFSGDVNAREDAQPTEIIHSHNFHRHLNAFKASWDPKDWKDDLFVCGRFLGDAYHGDGDGDDTGSAAILHPLDLFSAKAGSVVHSLVDPMTKLICTTNMFSPKGNFILTAASGDMILWAPPVPGAQKKDCSLDRGEKHEREDDDEDSDEDFDPAERKRRLKVGPVVKKRRTRAATRRNGGS